MKSLRYAKERYHNVYIALLFIIASATVVYIIPTEGKFRFEFQKGSPWQHESLMAPYDFPIYKTQKELDIERDSILNLCKFYFEYDNEIIARQFDTLIKTFHIRWEEQLLRNDSIFTDNEKDKASKKIYLGSEAYDKYMRKAQKAFKTGSAKLPIKTQIFT